VQRIIQDLAQSLWHAEQTARQTRPLRERVPGFTLAHAYAVQRAVTGLREEAGGRRVGWKIGLSSEAMMRRAGMDEPFWAPVFNTGHHGSGATLAIKRFAYPRLETEIALVLGADLDHRRISMDEARVAIAWVHPAFEIVDVRTTTVGLDALEATADSGWNAGFVLGAKIPAEGIDLSAVTARILDDGSGAEGRIEQASILIGGGPVGCLQWLAERAVAARQPLRAGDIILSGTILPVVPLKSGATVTAEFVGLGDDPVTVTVSGR
jgi:2-keto-4-pentenoate hydratase